MVWSFFFKPPEQYTSLFKQVQLLWYTMLDLHLCISGFVFISLVDVKRFYWQPPYICWCWDHSSKSSVNGNKKYKNNNLCYKFLVVIDFSGRFELYFMIIAS